MPLERSSNSSVPTKKEMVTLPIEMITATAHHILENVLLFFMALFVSLGEIKSTSGRSGPQPRHYMFIHPQQQKTALREILKQRSSTTK
ncbi:9961_t:CDS:2, partial [Paraglomus occultum]